MEDTRLRTAMTKKVRVLLRVVTSYAIVYYISRSHVTKAPPKKMTLTLYALLLIQTVPDQK